MRNPSENKLAAWGARNQGRTSEQDELSFERWRRELPGGSGGMHGPVVLYCELIIDWLAIYSG